MEKEITRTFRYIAPAHYSMKFEKFSLISEINKYESGSFEAGGYNWKLIFYPTGDKENSGMNHISLYLTIHTTDSLPEPWEVYVNFKLFVHNQVEDKYLIVQDNANGGLKRFNSIKKTWGFAQFLPLKTFKDSSNGYIVLDTCVFGAEVFVIKNSGKGESVSLVKAPRISNPIFTWEIKKFSEIDQEYIESPVFSVAQRDWKLKIFPKGENSLAGEFLAFYLIPYNWNSKVPAKSGVHAVYTLRVVDKVNGNHTGGQKSHCFSTLDCSGSGYLSLISMEDLHMSSNGYIVKDSLTVQVEFFAITESSYIGVE